MLAIIKAFRDFLPRIMGKSIQLVTDSTMVMYYINRQGGTQSLPLLRLAIKFWKWCRTHRIAPQAIHISSEENYLGDRLSGLPTRTHEWSLNDTVFLDICCRWGQPTIDLFASHTNAKCPRYCSRAGRDRTSLGDAFMVLWSGELTYLFPPIPVLLKMITRIIQYQTDTILIAPWWPRQPWFTHLS